MQVIGYILIALGAIDFLIQRQQKLLSNIIWNPTVGRKK
jgi:hypothetical protein